MTRGSEGLTYIVDLDNARSREAMSILDSSLFDRDFYIHQADIPSDLEECIIHYLEIGEDAGLFPNRFFDPHFYKSIAAVDLAEGENAFGHYVRVGRHEARFGSYGALSAMATDLAALLGLSGEAAYHELDAAGLTPLEAHLAYAWRRGERFLPHFDDSFYFEAYVRGSESPLPPMLHWAKVGLGRGYAYNEEELSRAREIIEAEFDEVHYRQIAALDAREDAVRHYLLHGWHDGHAPNKAFSVDYYLSLYPDIYRGRIEPFGHFIEAGRAEGRHPAPDGMAIARSIRLGKRRFDARKPTIMVSMHEASRTGAPLLAADLGDLLGKTYNVVLHSLSDGVIVPDLLSRACYVVIGLHGFDLEAALHELRRSRGLVCVVCNSVETFPVASAANAVGVACVGLLHEFADYTRPAGKLADFVASCQVTVCPAAVVAASALREVCRYYDSPPNSLVVRAQGRLTQIAGRSAAREALSIAQIKGLVKAGPATRIVLGAGSVQPRKGVDIFVQTAAKVRDKMGSDIRFVWIGGGYDPKTDLAMSVWLETAIERLGLETIVYFLPEQPDLAPALDVCHLFFLPSRLDPFPNVGVDALAAGRKIVCFERATGLSSMIDEGSIEGTAAPYLDADAAADAIVRHLGDEMVSDRNRDYANSELKMSSYVAFLGEQIDVAVERAAAAEAQLADPGFRDTFEARFYTADEGPSCFYQRAGRRYLARAQKGLVGSSPKIGVNEGARQHQGAGSGAWLAQPRAARPTHRVEISERLQPSIGAVPRTVIHLHLHYGSLAGELRDTLSARAATADLVVTVTKERDAAEVAEVFEGWPHGTVLVEHVTNLGRNIVPLVEMSIKHEFVRNYDLVCHIHGKRSVGIGTFGDGWRRFLIDSLVGSRQGYEGIRALFSRDDKLGLLFPEDRHAVGWSKNRDIADDIARRFGFVLPAFPIFPVGMMFWARPAIVASLADCLASLEVPPEPLADDGTVLHAVERIFPNLCETAGYDWATLSSLGLART